MCTKSHDSVSLLRKKLHVYFLYLSIDILVLGMQFSNVHACLSVCGVFYHYEVASELLLNLKFYLLLHVASYVFMDVTHIHLLNQSRPKT